MSRPFIQQPPSLGNQYDDDRVLRSYLARTLPPYMMAEVEPALRDLGHLAGGRLYRMQLADRLSEPVLTQWDAWGERIDRIELTLLWHIAEQVAVEHGVVAAAYENNYGPFARAYQFAMAYLFHPSADFYTCPLAMTDGAARTLLRLGNQTLIERAVPHFTSRDLSWFWTSGQWMTESSGGSDAGRVETVARPADDGTWRLYGRKWFTSATTAQVALVLARPEGNEPGSRGLALFYLEPRDAQGRLQNIQINRLKDKLGTRKLPTAELDLDGAPAQLVAGTTNGVAAMVPMLHLTRTWNSITAVATMRRGVALARSYAARRLAFGGPLTDKPLHADTLAGLQVEMEASFHLSFYLAELIGQDEAGKIDAGQRDLLRLLTSVAKLTTGRQVVTVISEVLEAFGGGGYMEDTGLPVLLRDSQVFPIWEGTTNVLALDALGALRQTDALRALRSKMDTCLASIADSNLARAGKVAWNALTHADRWLAQVAHPASASPPGSLDPAATASLEAGARRLAITLGRALSLALLISHAQWSLDNEHDGRARAAALRFASSGIDFIVDMDIAGAFALANDAPLPQEEKV